MIEQQKDHYESVIEDQRKRINILMQNDLNLKQNISTTLTTTQTIESLSQQLKSKEAQLEGFKQECFLDKKRACEELEASITRINLTHKQELLDAETKYQELVASFKLT